MPGRHLDNGKKKKGGKVFFKIDKNGAHAKERERQREGETVCPFHMHVLLERFLIKCHF